MKPILTAFGIVALLMLPATSNAQYNYYWLGGTSQWSLAGNWDGSSSGYPGQTAGDSATIDSQGTSPWPTLDVNLTGSSSPPYALASLTMRDGTSTTPTEINTGSYTLSTTTFTVSDSDSSCYAKQTGDGTISATTLLIQAGDSTDRDATLWVASGTCSPGTLDMRGSTTDANGHAVAEFDQSVTATTTTAIGFTDIDVASGAQFSPGTMTVGSSTKMADVVIGYDSGTGSVTPSSLTIRARDVASGDSICEVRRGTLDVSGTLTVQASQSYDSDATLLVPSTATQWEAGTLDMRGSTDSTKGYAVADFDRSVSAATGGSTTIQGYCDIDVQRNATFTAGDMTVGVSNTVSANVSITAPDGTSGTGQISATSITIHGGNSGTSITVGSNSRLSVQ